MTGDASKRYITDGLTEEVIHVMAQQPSLAVAARTSSFALRDLGMTAADIGDRLGVDSVVEGSVREERGVQRITVQLIDAKSGSHKGSVTLDIVDGDLFNAQARIAETIIQLLAEAGANVEPVVANTAGTASIRAYDFYLKGRAALHTRSTESLQAAKSYLQEAVQISDEFAPAHASLAQLYVVSRAYLRLGAEDARSLSESSFKRALALDPNNVEALVVAAALAADHGDYETSVGTFQRAIKLQPSHALAHLWFGEVLHLLGYTSAGWESISLALRLDPLAGSTNTVMAKSAAFFTDEERLLQAARQAESLNARHAPRFMAIHEFRSGNLRNFERELARYHDVIGIDQTATDLLVQAAEGSIDEASLIAQLEPFGLRQNNFFARELALLGMYSAALRAMLRVPSAEGTFIDDIWIPEFEPVRAMPEFIDLVRILGLDEYWRIHGMPDACNHGKPEPFCYRVAEAIGT
jgi:TolB-like protein/Tfp pilus assembly protein PilF